LFANVLNK